MGVMNGFPRERESNLIRFPLSGNLIKKLCGLCELERQRARAYHYKGDVDLDRKSLDLFLTESDLMQVSTSTHIIAPFWEDLGKHGFIKSNTLKWKADGSVVKTAGRVIIIHTPPTKSGKRVMFLTLEDEEGLFDLTVFEDIHARYAKKILASAVLLVEGVLNRFGLRGISIVARRFWTLREFYERIGYGKDKSRHGILDRQDPDRKRHLLPEASHYRGRLA
jgi:error-prone DNA polymerase